MPFSDGTTEPPVLAALGGRKFVISAAFLLLGFAVVCFGFVLAYTGKTWADFSQVCTMFFTGGAGIIAGFQLSNAWITTKAAEASTVRETVTTTSPAPPPAGPRIVEQTTTSRPADAPPAEG